MTTTVVPGELTALSEVEGEESEELVAVGLLTGGVDSQQSVGVTVEGETEVGAGLDHGGRQCTGRCRPDAVVDVGAIGLTTDGQHLGTELAIDGGGQSRRRTVGAVHDQTQPVEPPALGERAQVTDIGLAEAVFLAQSPDTVSLELSGAAHLARPGRARARLRWPPRSTR